MKQILHIFAKDTRRFWPEILISLALVVGVVSIHSYLWALDPVLGGHSGNQDNGALIGLFELLGVLLPVGWWVLIARAIHEERLVGNTQFWITRPYQWPCLLVAKLLFLAVFAYLPLLAMQAIVLAEEGFSVQAALPGLLFNLLLITGCLVLPLVAIATVTSSFARMTLTVLGALLALGVTIAMWAAMAPNRIDGPVTPRAAFLFALALAAAAIAVQYARRRAWLARALLLAFPVLLVVLAWVAPDQRLMDRRYPALSGNAAPVRFSYRPDALHPNISGAVLGNGHKTLRVSIPLRLEGLGAGYGLAAEGIKATIEGPDGSHWSSAWQPFRRNYLPRDIETTADFALPEAVYDRAKSTPVTVRLALTLTQIQAGQTTRVPLSADRFEVPGFAICAWRKDLLVFSCRSALRPSALTLIGADLPGLHSGGGVEADSYWAGSLDGGQTSANIVPVQQLFLGSYLGSNNVGGTLRLAPRGTPILFTRYTPVRRMQVEVVLTEYRLPPQMLTPGAPDAPPPPQP